MSTYRIPVLGSHEFPIRTLLKAAVPSNGLRSELDRVMQETFNGIATSNERGGSLYPPVTAVESTAGFTLEMDVPGVAPAAIAITAEDGVLTVRGSRPGRENGPRDRVLFAERMDGEFVRQFRLPKAADENAITANYALGVLTIRVHKVAPPQPRPIAITVDAAANGDARPRNEQVRDDASDGGLNTKHVSA